MVMETKWFWKRTVDVVGSASGLLLASPLIALLAAAVRLTMGNPAIFRQQRGGSHGRVFTLYKFRTMRDLKDPGGKPAPDSERLTALGRLLRHTSMDELPQLWNVFKGDMSLVGPRPLLAHYLTRYTSFQRRRHEVKPGITGLAQIHGRNAVDWPRKFELDVQYVDTWTLGLDFRILAITAWNLVRRGNAAGGAYDTIPEFSGPEFSGALEESVAQRK